MTGRVATYSLSGSGTQTLTTGVTALHVTISTLPAGAGHGLASPTDYWGIGSLRPGNATAFWEPFVICGGPQWLAVPFGTTRLGYAFAATAVVSVVEVFNAYPLSVPLAGLPDVALSSPADAQVLAYQSSSSKWINATPAGGGGSSNPPSAQVSRNSNSTHANATTYIVTFNANTWNVDSMWNSGAPDRLTVHTAGKYVLAACLRFDRDRCECQIELNGATILVNAISPTGGIASCSTVARLAVNDYIRVGGFNSSGLSVTMYGTPTYPYSTLFSATKIADY